MTPSPQSGRVTPARFAVWVALTVGAAWLVFDGGGWFGIYASTARLVNLGIAAGLLLAWAAIAIRRPAWQPRSALLPALLVCLGSMFISTITSRSPRVSLEYLAYAILLVALYLLLVRLFADAYLRRRLLVTGAFLFVVLAADFLIRALLLWVDWWGAIGRVTIPPLRPSNIGLSYANPSTVLTMVALLAVPAVYLVPRRARPVGTALVVGLVGLVALISGSRAGWLAIAISGLTSVVLALFSPSVPRALAAALRGIRQGELRLQAAVAALVAVGLILATAVVLPAVSNRTGAGGEELRTTFWVVALRLFAAAPLLGTGPGTWVIDRIAATQPTETDYYIPHAHDVPVQTLAELGLVGALAGGFLIASVVALLWSHWRRHDADRRWLAWVAFAALLYLALHDLLDFYPNFPAVLFAAALPLAYLDAVTGPEDLPRWIRFRPARSSALPGRRPIGFATAGLVALALVGVLVQEVPAQQNEQAAAAADGGDWEAALAPAEAAARTDPDVHAYAMTAGLAAAHAGDLAKAGRYFRVVAQADDLPEAWLDLASVEADQQHRDEAMADLANAVRLGLQRAPIAMAVGDLYLRLGAVDDAVTAFAAAVALRPSLAADPWWHADTTRERLYPTIVAKASADAPVDRRWEIALMAGDSGATALAEMTARPELSSLVTSAWGGDQSDKLSLYARCDAKPLDAAQLMWCARIASRSGSVEEADRFRTIAEVVSLGATEYSAELRVLTSSPVAWITNQTAMYWGLYTYRRPTPRDILVPGLVHLELK